MTNQGDITSALAPTHRKQQNDEPKLTKCSVFRIYNLKTTQSVQLSESPGPVESEPPMI